MCSQLIKMDFTDNTSDNGNRFISYEKYNELLTDYNNMKSRFEKKQNKTERDCQTKFLIEILMPIYNYVCICYYGKMDHDMGYIRDAIIQEIEYLDYTIMDKVYFKKYNMIPKEIRPDIDSVAEVVSKSNAKSVSEHNNIDSVIKPGLYDKIRDKVVLFPKVSVFIYE